MPQIKIISKRDGYYRAGVRHSRAGEIHPADRFSAEQLQVLQADPVLTVVEVDDSKADTKGKAEQTATAKAGTKGK